MTQATEEGSGSFGAANVGHPQQQQSRPRHPHALSESLTINPHRRSQRSLISSGSQRSLRSDGGGGGGHPPGNQHAMGGTGGAGHPPPAEGKPIPPQTTYAPANVSEQLHILQSFTLTKNVSSVDEAVDLGLAAALLGKKNDEETDNGTSNNSNNNKNTRETLDKLVKAQLEEYGPNELPKPEMPSYFSLFLGAFEDIMMILLVIAMIVLYAVGDAIAATAILIIVLIATNIGAYTEYSSNKAAAELGDLPGSSLVRARSAGGRDAEDWWELPNTQLLPGMLVQIRTGDIVPADAIILTQKGDNCSCTESMLTGESEPVPKTPFYASELAAIDEEEDPHAAGKRESQTRLYMGTEFAGDCLALVVETGERTQMGQIYQSMSDKEAEMSPLQIMIDRLIVTLAVLSIAASVLNAVICIPTGRGVEPDPDDPQALVCTLNSVALTVAAVPENLPVALVIALAAIIKNLATRGVIVKSLPAGEELSRLNYVFSDKTGTLTKNEMTARAVITVDGFVGLSEDFAKAPAESPALDADTGGALTDQIRILAARAQDDVRSNPTGDACKKAYPEDSTLDFERVLLETASSKTKMARAAVTIAGKNYLAKVGSDWVLEGATGQATLETDLSNFSQDTVDEFDKPRCMKAINDWAEDGYRVICVTVKPVESLPAKIVEDKLGEFGDGFIFLGCLAIQDPPREDVAENIRIISDADVVVSMITGDNPVTGMSIAKQVGLASNFTEEDKKMCLINTFELYHNMEEEEAKKDIHHRLHYSMTHKKSLIIGRVSPFQKRWFVEVAKAMGLIVAMTGDGANDAPALKSAHVGIAMGNGSDIAKAAGDMILVNQSFVGIVEAIRAGRLGFDNILKFLLFLLGTNISEVFIYLLYTFCDIVIVLNALNLLVLNLLTDGFPAIALSVEKAEGDLMKRSPLRQDASVLNSFTYVSITITNLALMGSYLLVTLLGNHWHLGSLKGVDTEAADDYDQGLEKVRMMFILLINISELLLGFSHRSPDRSVFSVGFFSGKWMNYASLSSIAIIIVLTHLPGLKEIMRCEYLDLRSYLLVAAASVFPFIVHEIAKVLIFERFNFNVYDLYKYEYIPREDDELLKAIEDEARPKDDDDDDDKNENGGNAEKPDVP